MLDIISGVISNLSAAKGIADGLIDLRDANVVATVKADLTERILNAQAQLSQVLATIIDKDARIAELERNCRELEKQQMDRARYELHELEVGGGVFVYSLKPADMLCDNQSEVSHFVCQPCLDIRGHKAVLRKSDVWGTDVFTCPACKTEFNGGRNRP